MLSRRQISASLCSRPSALPADARPFALPSLSRFLLCLLLSFNNSLLNVHDASDSVQGIEIEP